MTAGTRAPLYRRVRHLPRRVRRLSWRRRVLLAKAAMLVALVRIGLKVLPFKTVVAAVRSFGRPVARLEAAPAPVEDLAWGVHAVSRRALQDRPCLTQALALLMLARRRGYTDVALRIGVKKDAAGRLLAHAWIERADRVLIGGLRDLADYNVLPPLQALA